MNRRQLREYLFKLLFRIEFNSEDEMKEQCELFFDDVDTSFDIYDAEYIQSKYNNIMHKLPEIDRLIEDKAKGWSVSRMSKVDLTIIRLGLYEVLYDDDIHPSIAINEAVELAKKFGQEKSNGFVNAVLAKFIDAKKSEE